MLDLPFTFGFLRISVISPELRVADISFNTTQIVTALQTASSQGSNLAVFPELCITGYTCADLFYQSLLISNARDALRAIVIVTAEEHISAVVGLPIDVNGKLYNCAVFINSGKILGVVPKIFLPNTQEYYEKRWFSSGKGCRGKVLIFDGDAVPFGTDILFEAQDIPNCTIGMELCEDLWAVIPPSGNMALAGATIITNISASNEIIGKVDYRRELVKQQSARCLAAYIYSDAGPGESSTDIVFSGHSLIAENGTILIETNRFQFTTQIATTDIDLQRLSHDRLLSSSYASYVNDASYKIISFSFEPKLKASHHKLLRPILPTPFVPIDSEQRSKYCKEIIDIQSTGLAKRLKHIKTKNAALAVSGGLDSTLALLVTCRAFDVLGLSRSGIMAITMPGFGTTGRTRSNAEHLANMLGVTLRIIPIHDAVNQHFMDIGHDKDFHNITYENAQARERTQILLDVANQINGLGIGTGDLSEIALGWCTYNGDQMSMYHVNAGIPKTLVRYLIDWFADCEYTGKTSIVLRDICDTPISPELLPISQDPKKYQETETTIGPYILHDFFLYYTVRYGFTPQKVFYLAKQAFENTYSPDIILRWMKVFYSRFIKNQFKRSAMPDGPKVGSVSLSPRGDWRMPSDASSDIWVKELTEIIKSQDRTI